MDGIPEFSWKLGGKRNGILQGSYRIVVTGPDHTVCWDSGVIVTRRQGFIRYRGLPLLSRSEYHWTVTVTDDQGETAEASASFFTGLLSPSDWEASWISASFARRISDDFHFGGSGQPIEFRRTFSFAKTIKKATLYATCYGIYRAEVNGFPADDRSFAPEFTSYANTLYYQTYDITDLLCRGSNTLSFTVADGWYFSPQAGSPLYEKVAEPAMLYQLELTFEEGSGGTIRSDGSETCRTTSCVYADLYTGEKTDFTVSPGEWKSVVTQDYGYDNLRAQALPPVRPFAELPVQTMYLSPNGETILDFGQNITGRTRVRIHAPAGTEITLDHFEVPDCSGNYLNTMFAPQKDIIISDGTERDYEPGFTFHGFRYVRVSGLETIDPKDFTAVALTTEKESVGSFRCSDARINQLYENIRRSQRDNMLSIPTDCPTREKAGWTGDLLIYADTALKNDDVTSFFMSWLRSLREEQGKDGAPKIVAPYMNLYETLMTKAKNDFDATEYPGVAGWGDAIVWVPWSMYRATDNIVVLEENFDAMKQWAGYLLSKAQEHSSYDIPLLWDTKLWNTGFHFGEWLIPSTEEQSADPYDFMSLTTQYIGPFFAYETIRRVAEIAALLGHDKEAAYYASCSDEIKEAIQKGILEPDRLPHLMGAYVLAVSFDLVPEHLAGLYAKRLAALVEENGYRLDTGFLATPFLMDALDKIGRRDLSYKLLFQENRPSWLYEVNHGATTIWESWNADTAQENARIVSFNHYAFGCIDDWICRVIGGIALTDPHHLLIAPDPNGPIASAERTWDSGSGPVKVHWTREQLTVTVPCNMTATVRWGGSEYEVGSGTYTWKTQR